MEIGFYHSQDLLQKNELNFIISFIHFLAWGFTTAVTVEVVACHRGFSGI